MDTRAIIVLLVWPKFRTVAMELKLTKQLPKGEKVFMITTPTDTYGPLDLIPSA